MKSYSNYKDSGVKWLGQIPQHWEVRRGRSLFSLNNQGSTSTTKIGLENIEGFTGKFIPTESTFEGGGVQVEEGDIVYGKLRPYLCKSWLATFGCNAVGDFFVFRCHNKNYNKYLHQVFLSPGFTDICNASTYGAKMPRVSSSFILSLPFPLPPLSEQLSIVSYLDGKVSAMDRLVLLTQQKVEHLKALKQAIIQQTVTRGIPNKNHILKQTNIKWIKQIPQHWEVKSLRSFIRIYSEKNHPDEQLLSVVREQGVIIRNKESKDENHNYIPEDLSGYKFVDKGDFVINKMKAWQGSYAVSEFRGIVSPAYFTCHLENINKKFFSIAIRSSAYIAFFAQYSKGIRVGQWDLSPLALKEIPFFLPPLSEQEEIVAYLDEKTAKIDLLIDKELQQIDHIKDLKQTLIADVVTGKVDVTTKH